MGRSARKTDPWTSHAAGQNSKKKSEVGRLLVLKALAKKPMNDFELAEVTGWQQTSIGKRRLECQEAGLVTEHLDSNNFQITRPSPSGSKSLVWEITFLGRIILGRFNHES